MSSNIRIEKVCQYCGVNFIDKTTVTRYCSHTCNEKTYKLEQRNLKISYARRQAIRSFEEWQYQPINDPVYLTVKETFCDIEMQCENGLLSNQYRPFKSYQSICKKNKNQIT